MMRSAVAALTLSACGAAAAGPEELEFEVRELHLGHPTTDVQAFDHDLDGDLDVVVSGGARVSVLEGDGTGRLTVGDPLPAGEHPVDLVVGDLDGDGHADVVVANHETTYLTLLFGGSQGLDPRRTERLTLDVSPHPHAVALADLDGDGHLDLLVDDRDRRRLAVWIGAGDGTFEPGQPVDVGGDPYRGMAVADLDADGHLDVVTPNPRAVAVQTGDGRGRFSRGVVLDSEQVPPFSVAVADLDGDGNADVAAGSGEGPGAVVVWRGDGGGGFVPARGSPFRIADGPTSLGTADVDGDGVTDLLVTSYVGDEVAVLYGGEELRVARIPVDDHPWGVGAGDLDGDGAAELLVARDGGPDVAVLVRRSR